jgi:3-oxoacyl-[acyl-carrier-protein] synthase III
MEGLTQLLEKYCQPQSNHRKAAADMTVGIIGCGYAVPERIVANDEFDSIGLTDQWITRRTGIRKRHRLQSPAQLEDLAVNAIDHAVRSAGIAASSIDVVMVATATAERRIPPLSACVSERVCGAGVPAFDLNAACSGFVYGVVNAIGLIESGRFSTAIVCGAEGLSAITNPRDRNTACLFGDGAAAVVLSGNDAFRKPYCSAGSDGRARKLIQMDDMNEYLQMEGLDLYELAVARMSNELKCLLSAECEVGNLITMIIPHQANGKMLTAIAGMLPKETASLIYSNIDEVGNTSAASIPLAFSRAVESGKADNSGRLAAVAFGSGATWGAIAIDYRFPVQYRPSVGACG